MELISREELREKLRRDDGQFTSPTPRYREVEATRARPRI